MFSGIHFRWTDFVAVIVLTFGAGCAERSHGPQLQFPSPMSETVRAHSRVEQRDWPGRSITVRGILPSDVSIFIPDSLGVDPDLLVHFHGAEYLVQNAVSRSMRPMIGVTVNLGSGSSVYERPFEGADAFGALLDSVRTRVTFGRVFLSSWSAGYGAVRAILRTGADRIDGVLLLDGLHTDYVPAGTRLADGGALNEAKMEPFRLFASGAARGAKRMIITHSEIFPGTYASTTETASWLSDTLGIETAAVLEWGPGGMQVVSRAEVGRLSIMGFAGNTAPDHVDHLHALAYFVDRLVAP